jgi:hypothetical protein
MKTLMFAAAAMCSLTLSAEAKGPELPREITLLHRLVGEWTTRTGTVNMGGKQGKLDIKVSCALTPNKVGVLCQSRITIEGLGTIEGTDLFGYDPGSKTYHWFCVNGMGETHDHVAKPPGAKDKGFTWVHEGLDKDGKSSREVIVMALDDSGGQAKMEFRNDISIDGKPAIAMVAAMSKK